MNSTSTSRALCRRWHAGPAVASLAIALCAGRAHAQRAAPPPWPDVPSAAVAARFTTSSPTIAALAARVRDADPRARAEAVGAFWREMAERHTPIIEPDDAQGRDAGTMLVTFVYRDTVGARNVTLFGGVAGWNEALQQMDHLPGTDIWYRSVRVPRSIRVGYQFHPNDDLIPWWSRVSYAAWMKGTVTDPFNPMKDSGQGPRSLLVGPDADPQPLVARRAGVPAGRLDTTTLASALLGNRRRVYVYTPSGYDSATARRRGGAAMLVMFDGEVYAGRTVPTPTILDNLLAEHRIEPVVGVFVGNAIGIPNARMRELACDSTTARMVVEELLPWVRAHYAVTADPGRVAVGGSSHGGLMAICAALHSPATFGNVISQSASAWWAPAGDREWEWPARTFAERPRLPIRFYLEVGTFEVDRGQEGSPGQVGPNRHLRDVLRAKGYDVTYREFPGGHEYFSWRGTLGPALEQMLGRAP
jgi:enterochelin esterase family protein